MIKKLQNYLIDSGLSQDMSYYGSYLILALAVIVIAWLVNFIARKVILSIVAYFIRKSKTTWDDILLERKVFSRLSHLAPAMVFYYSASLFGVFSSPIQKLSMVYMILAGFMVINSILDAIVVIYRSFEIARQRPIKGYVQIAKIIIFIFIAIFALSVLLDRSPLLLLSGLGAMTAILLLVFKDSILGLVASIQLSMNDMVRVGDWIEMPKYGADGDVIDISLHIVKIQNWDKTISTIPAYALISDAFKNWRGMDESGGRRIKRSINIDMSSIKFLDGELLARLDKFEKLTKYLKEKIEEVSKFNIEQKVDVSYLINGRHLTNIGTFRAYIQSYLKDHPSISNDMTFLIRQLAPGPDGLPMEIYVFSNDQDWIRYEGIQSDIFDHILSVIPLFDLKVFQHPTGADFKKLQQGGF